MTESELLPFEYEKNDDGTYTVLKLKDKSTEKVTVPDGVSRIAEYAFQDCKNIQEIVIPPSLKSADTCAFTGTEIKKVFIFDLTAWCDIEFKTPRSNPLYGEGTLYLNGEEVRDLVVPDGLTKIKRNAFTRCGSIVTVEIPDGVTLIDEYAFGYCENIAKVHVPKSLKEIAAYGFGCCCSLQEINVSSRFIKIGLYAFLWTPVEERVFGYR